MPPPTLSHGRVRGGLTQEKALARRAIMPRLALKRPVWPSSRSSGDPARPPGEREPHVDNGRRGAFRTADRQLGGGLASGRDGFTVMLCPSIRDPCNYNILQKLFCSINYVHRISLGSHLALLQDFLHGSIYSCLIL